MSELLLELLSEEIPARMQQSAIEALTGLLRDKLEAAQLPAAELRGHVTPRRLAVIADGIPARQPDRAEERRGPRRGAPQAAIEGFARAAGLADIGECEVRDTGRGEFYFAVLHRRGRSAAEVLPELIRAAMAELPWPKSMRWPASPLRWVRPLSSVLCLLDGEVLPLALGGIPVGRATRGHRFLAPGKICVGNASDYVARLADAQVVLDREQRRKMIATGLDEAASKKGFRVKPDLGLLEEVTGLAEFPVVLMGSIDAGYVAPPPEGLPPEVLATAMRTHQKYFSCQYPDGSTAPFFLFVANNRTDDGGATIITGNERVLRARLADARFFWDQDRRIRLEDRLDALKDRVFHAKLGSVYDKVVRIEALAHFLGQRVPGADAALSRRAARLAKADLSTGMVGEFPELQGTMGQYYYLQEALPGNAQKITLLQRSLIAAAIGDHYRPLGPNDRCPRAPESIVVALADKLDSLVAFFAVGEEPTGSRDPYALRRAALGIIRIIVENSVRLNLKDAFSAAAEIFYRERRVEAWEPRVPRLYAELMTFVVERLKAHLRELGVRHDLIAAAFAQVGAAESDLVRLLKRVDALGKFLAGEDGADLLTAYRRASNIVRIEDQKDGRARSVDVEIDRLDLPEEKALGRSLELVARAMQAPLEREDFEGVMGVLAQLRRPVDEFFDNVTVNTSDESLRENRLRLLARIRAEMNRVADFSQIEG